MIAVCAITVRNIGMTMPFICRNTYRYLLSRVTNISHLTVLSPQKKISVVILIISITEFKRFRNRPEITTFAYSQK